MGGASQKAKVKSDGVGQGPTSSFGNHRERGTEQQGGHCPPFVAGPQPPLTVSVRSGTFPGLNGSRRLAFRMVVRGPLTGEQRWAVPTLPPWQERPAGRPSPGARGSIRIPPADVARRRLEGGRAEFPASPWRGLDQPLSGPDRFPVANSLLRGEGGRCIGHGLLPASSLDGGRKRRLGPGVFGPQLSFLRQPISRREADSGPVIGLGDGVVRRLPIRPPSL